MQLALFCLKLCGERNTGLRAIAAPSYKQPNKLSQLHDQNTQLNLPNVNIDKLMSINRRWKCKKGRLTITASSLTKIDQHGNFTSSVSRRHRVRCQG